MSRTRPRGAIPLALLASFAAGVLIDGWLRMHGPPRPAQMEEVRLKPDTTGEQATGAQAVGASTSGAQATGASPAAMSAPRVPLPSSAMSATGRSSERPSATSGSRATDADASVVSGFSRTSAGAIPGSPLRMPIDGKDVDALKGGFVERRGNRPHEAADILAPRDTPVHAVENGTVAKLFTSKAGGLTIYQFDPSGRLCYYYAHLSRYAAGLTDGKPISQGEVIGYVGTTGNAPPNTPHLHFAVFELNADKHWWQGRPVDPYLVFRDRDKDRG